MRLLIVTQKLYKNDDLLGFMHGWVAEFSKQFESIIVVALGVGLPCEISQGDNFSERKIISQEDYHLPKNVKVLSLGKEQYLNHSSAIRKLVSLYRFYKYIFQYKGEYDSVFVHMNREYMLLGGLFWRLWGKKTALWYNHGTGNILSSLAGFLAQKIFCTSPFSFFAKWPKTSLMPAGINTDIFKKDEKIQPTKNSILFLSRISPIKGLHLLVEAVNLLDKEGIDFVLNVVGEAGENDKEYFKKLKDSVSNLEQKGKIKFWGKIPNYKTPEVYNQNEVIVNLTESGSFDKIILEAMACEKLVLVCNKSFLEILPDALSQALFFEEGNIADLKNKLINILNGTQSPAVGKQLREIVLKKHSLTFLSQRLSEFFAPK